MHDSPGLAFSRRVPTEKLGIVVLHRNVAQRGERARRGVLQAVEPPLHFYQKLLFLQNAQAKPRLEKMFEHELQRALLTHGRSPLTRARSLAKLAKTNAGTRQDPACKHRHICNK